MKVSPERGNYNRRTIIRGGALIPVAALAAPVAALQAADPHPVWLDQWQRVHDAWLAADEDSPEDKRLSAEEMRLGDLIATTPVKTVAGAAAVVAWVLKECGSDDFQYRNHHPALRNVLSALQGKSPAS